MVQRNAGWVREMRRRLGMTQRQLAKAVHVSPAFIGEVEVGDRAVSAKVENGILALLDEAGFSTNLRESPLRVKDADNDSPITPSPGHGDGGDAVGQAGPIPPGASSDELLRHVILELTMHLRRVDDNDRLRIETVQAPEARARETAEKNIQTMLGMLSSSQDTGRQGADDGSPQGPTTGTAG